MESTEAAYQREYRRRRKANGGARLTQPVVAVAEPEPSVVGVSWPSDPAGAIQAWAIASLKVPPGHPAAGKPLELPQFIIDFFRDALADGIFEAGLFCARKQAKSAAIAVLLLAHLAEDGPLRSPGFRAGAVSVSKEKAVELWQQCRDIASASGLEGIFFGKVPRVVSSRFGRAEFLSADASSGHSSSFDVSIIDELGIMHERDRELLSGMISATSAKNGRLLCISILGRSPLSAEMVDRAGRPGTVIHLHQAKADCGLFDRDEWRKANPALGQIKSFQYMEFAADRAASTPSEEASFRSHHLNQPVGVSQEMICGIDRWVLCETKPRPDRTGPVHIGVDLGGSTSLSAIALFWPTCSRLEVYVAAGSDPDLATRGRRDGVGDRYERMESRGELRTFGGRVTPCAPLLEWVAELTAEEQVVAVVADRYRESEFRDAMDAAGVSWRTEFRAQGSGQHGSEDIRSFQKSVEGGTLRPGQSLALSSAIRDSVIRYDQNNNPSLEKARTKGRIDPLSAAVLAVGAGSRAAVPEAEVSYFHIPI